MWVEYLQGKYIQNTEKEDFRYGTSSKKYSIEQNSALVSDGQMPAGLGA